MLIYWANSAGGVQEVNYDIEEDYEGCQIQKSHMKNDEDKKQITNPMVNTIFIFNMQKNNNCNNARFGMEKSTDDMSTVLTESIAIFIWSSGVFA